MGEDNKSESEAGRECDRESKARGRTVAVVMSVNAASTQQQRE